MADNQTQSPSHHSSDYSSDPSSDAHQSPGDPMEQSFSDDQAHKPNMAEIANAYRVLASQYQGFVANPATLTPDGAVLLQEIRNMRTEMKRGFKKVDKRFGQIDKRFDQIEKRGRAE
jgi:hypothetical protein